MNDHQSKSSQSRLAARSLRAALACALAFATLATQPAGAAGRTKGITGGLESGTELVTLPASPSGSFLARECRDCPSIRVSFDSNTRFLIGDQAVSYAKFREAAKGDIRLYVSYRLSDRTLTRLRISAPGT